MKKQAIALLGVITATALLAGCHHGDNKLLKEPKKDVIKFLSDAEMYASKKTGVYDAVTSTYNMCVTNPKHFNNPFTGEKGQCQKFFKAIVEYSKKSKVFNGIDVSDLDNKDVIQRIGDGIDKYDMSHY